MLKRLTFCSNHNKFRHWLPKVSMFHRAASSATIPIKQPAYTNHPFKLSQPSAMQEPLSPKHNSTINARQHDRDDKNKPQMRREPLRKSHSLLEAINDSGTSQYNSPLLPGAAPPVYFNEEDFDDDYDLNFDHAPDQGRTQQTPSSAISWAPSSYTKPSPSSKPDVLSNGAPTTHVDKISDKKEISTNLQSAFLDSRESEKQSQSKITPRVSPTPAKKPRLLPWAKDATAYSGQPGPKVMHKRLASTAVAAHEEECDIEQIDRPVKASNNPYEMTQSAVKAAIKGRGRKRGPDEMAPPEMNLSSRKQKESGASDVAKVFLSAEQRGVIEMLKTGKSVFFTGSAGTGKSVLLRTAIQELRLKHKNLEKVAVTASTGLAACNIGGITLHSFAGVGLGRDSIPEMVKKVKRNKKNVLKWTKTKVLIIDEISMVDAEFFDKLEAVARKLRANEKPWGGIQIVATGDFFQLPPVPDQGKIAKFAFEAEKWKSLDATIQLTTVFRQKDEAFITMLNQMRTGSLSAKTIESFKQLQRPLSQDDGIFPTELFPTRHEVDNANAMRMRLLPGEVKSFDAEDSGSITDVHQRAKLLSNCMAPLRLDLKKGAQVMLIKNRDEGLVNGSLGVVIGFMNEKTYTYAYDEIDGSFNDSVLRDSPWTEAELMAMDKSAAGKRKMQRMIEMQNNSATQRVWPVVRFKSANGGQDITQLMSPESWKIEQPNGEVQACRKQVPLILAYAISIHKAQGQTIEKVKVDLGKVFEKGQAYVALSRAVSKEGLQILRFDAKKVMAHPKVAAFYRELCDATDAMEQSAAGMPDHEDLFEDSEFDGRMTTQEVFSQIKREPMKAYGGQGTRSRAGRGPGR